MLTPFPFQNPVDSPDFNQRLDEIEAMIAGVLTAGLVDASTTLQAQALAGQKVLDTVVTTGFVVGDSVWIGTPGSGLQESGVIDSISAGVSITLEDNLANTHAIGSPVSRSPAEIVNARSIFATLGRRLDVLGLGLFPVQAYGAVGDGIADDTTAVQNAITAAFNAPGGTVVFAPGDYKITAPLVTPADVAGAVKLMGTGRPQGFTGGSDGDSFLKPGTTLTYTGTTGSIFHAVVSSGNKRQYITIDGISFKGNTAGTSGHGLHFEAVAVGSVAILVTLRDVTVNNCKQHGIFFDGNVFESQLFNVRSSQNSGNGFHAAFRVTGLPGETRFYGCTFNQNNVGLYLSGGGQFSLHGVTATTNINEGLIAEAVGLTALDLNLELNSGTGALARQAWLNQVTGAQIIGMSMQVETGSIGVGIQLTNCLWVRIQRFGTNWTAGGAGYKDFVFDASSSRCIVDEYSPDNFSGGFDLGTGGGHVVRQGGTWVTNQTHGTATKTNAVDGTQTFDAKRHDCFRSVITGVGVTVTIDTPTMYLAFHDGQRVTVQCFNNTAGGVFWSWNAIWHLAGAWVNPAAGKTRTITFEWNETRAGFFEVARSAADIT